MSMLGDYYNPSSALAVGIVFMVLGPAAVGGRFHVRRKTRVRYGADDWLCLAALVFVMVNCGITIAGSRTGTIGSHAPPGLTPMQSGNYQGAEYILIKKLQLPFNTFLLISLGLMKCSILSFYRRIFRGNKFRAFSLVLMLISAAWSLSFIIALLAACGDNISLNWGPPRILRTQCANTFVIFICLAVFDVAVDLAIMILPMPSIWALQMPTKHKLAVSATFIVGALTIACALARLVSNAQTLGAAVRQSSGLSGRNDPVGVVGLLLFWGMLEMGVGIVAICLPTLRPLFHGWSPESIVRSFRSAISLGSLGSNRATREEQTPRKPSEGSNASDV